MFLCSNCKERERSWTWVGSCGHCENVRCENYIPPISEICKKEVLGESINLGKTNCDVIKEVKIPFE